MNPPFVRRSGIVRTTPAEVLPLVLTLVPAHKYILVSSSPIVSPGQVGFVEWDRSWCSWIDSWRCNWASFPTFDSSTNCSAFVKPRAHLDSVSFRHKQLISVCHKNNKESFVLIRVPCGGGLPSASPRHRPWTREQNVDFRRREKRCDPAGCETRQWPTRT